MNYYLLSFRGTPFTFSDLTSISTATDVMNQYQIVPNMKLFVSGLVLILILAFIFSFKDSIHESYQLKASFILKKVTICVLATAILIHWTLINDWSSNYGITFGWAPLEQYNQYGFTTAFIESGKEMMIQKPDNYSLETVKDTLDNYKIEEEEATVKPTIIGIMNETFFDLGIIGELECSNDVLSYYKSLKEDEYVIEYGYMYQSNYGCGTANIEFEALTSDSYSFVKHVMPYNIFDFSNVTSITSVLKEYGYQTSAFHPCVPSNYKRNQVYEDLGFDDFYSTENLYAGMTTYRGWVVSDLDDYLGLIQVYEEKAQNGNPQYMFNVTMQNHGGYDINQVRDSGGLIDEVEVDEQYQNYTDFVAYESFLEDSDNALRYLLDYFSNVDEPVIIYFFGDHGPSLNNDFLNVLKESGRKEGESDLDVAQKSQGTPYFIWANYEVNDSEVELYCDENGMNMTSPMYFNASIAQYSGVGNTAYYNYLMSMREEIPAMNALGWMDQYGVWHEYTDENESINEYYILEYAHLFNGNNPLIEELFE